MPRASALLHHMRGDYVEAVRSWLRLRDPGPALGYIGRYGDGAGVQFEGRVILGGGIGRGDCWTSQTTLRPLPPRLHATRSSLAVGMPTPRDHARMLEALSTHALVLVRRDAAAAALLVTLHLPPSEQEALLTRAQVCVGTRWGRGGWGGQKLPGSRRTAPTTIGAWSIAGRDSWVVF